MAYKIQNSDTIKNVRDSARLSISEGFPDKLDEGVKAIIDVTPRNNRIATLVRHATATGSTNALIYTTPTTKDTYITACSVSYSKDATATGAEFWIQTTIDGRTAFICRVAGLTTTAGTQSMSMSFPVPIKVDRGVSISIFADAFNANQRIVGTVVGYEVDI